MDENASPPPTTPTSSLFSFGFGSLTALTFVTGFLLATRQARSASSRVLDEFGYIVTGVVAVLAGAVIPFLYYMWRWSRNEHQAHTDNRWDASGAAFSVLVITAFLSYQASVASVLIDHKEPFSLWVQDFPLVPSPDGRGLGAFQAGQSDTVAPSYKLDGRGRLQVAGQQRWLGDAGLDRAVPLVDTVDLALPVRFQRADVSGAVGVALVPVVPGDRRVLTLAGGVAQWAKADLPGTTFLARLDSTPALVWVVTAATVLATAGVMGLLAWAAHRAQNRREGQRQVARGGQATETNTAAEEGSAG